MPKLSRNSLARIGRAVRESERTLPGPPRRDRTSINATPGFWIELLEEGDEGDLIGWYKWKLVYPNTDGDAGWTDGDEDSGEDFTATGANGTPHLVGQRVRVAFCGYYGGDDPPTPVYIFEDDSTKLHRVRLDSLDDGTYDVYPWSDPLFETVPIKTAATPDYRPLGSDDLDFSHYASTGVGHYDDGDFMLMIALGEVYDLADCGDEDVELDGGEL